MTVGKTKPHRTGATKETKNEEASQGGGLAGPSLPGGPWRPERWRRHSAVLPLFFQARQHLSLNTAPAESAWVGS